MPRTALHLTDPDDFGTAVLAGLVQSQKTIPARYFYDQAGSELFEEITRLPEYYPTRTEVGLLAAHGEDIAAAVGPGRVVVEFGSGSSLKTPGLLQAVAASAYVPIDISAEFLQLAADDLAAKLPGVPVLPVAADFTRKLTLPLSVTGLAKLGFFPGSTLGNCAPPGAVDLLRAFAATLYTATSTSWLVIGLDLRKDRATLEAAYDDAAGVTARFNLNLLHRINRELGGTIDVTQFRHRALWNDDRGRVEMHLESLGPTIFEVLGQSFSMHEAETIHTENSYKWTLEEARLLARASGWSPVSAWTDADRLFSLHLWRAAGDVLEP